MSIFDRIFKPPGEVAEATGINPGGGRSAEIINDALSRMTGAYEVITGAGAKTGPAPDVKASNAGQPNYLLWGGVALGVALVLWLILRKK